MKLLILSFLAACAPYTVVAMADLDAAVALLSVVLGGGGIFGIVKVWLAARSKREDREAKRAAELEDREADRASAREKRSDARLSSILGQQREEREKDRAGERAERERQSDRFDQALQRSVTATEKLTDEIRGLLEDAREGRHCRAPQG